MVVDDMNVQIKGSLIGTEFPFLLGGVNVHERQQFRVPLQAVLHELLRSLAHMHPYFLGDLVEVTQFVAYQPDQVADGTKIIFSVTVHFFSLNK